MVIASHQYRILVAEDNPALGAMLKFSLASAGFAVTLAPNGQVAWDCLQSEPYDLLVTDHQMPELTGCELCRKIRGSPEVAEMPIIMVSTKGLELSPSILDRIGVRDVVAKPFSPRELIARIEARLATVGV